MKPLIRMTGPHPSLVRRDGKTASIWRVAVVVASGYQPTGKVYRCLSYRRAVSLSCNMARDRRLFLRMDALPPLSPGCDAGFQTP